MQPTSRNAATKPEQQQKNCTRNPTREKRPVIKTCPPPHPLRPNRD
jgi:hypothetical protein